MPEETKGMPSEQPNKEGAKTEMPGKRDPKDVQENKVFAAISYLGIISLIIYLVKKDSEFAKFHAKQGLTLFIIEIIIGVLSAIPFLGWIVGPLLYLVIVIFSIIGIIKGATGQWYKLPLVGDIAEKFKL